MLEKLVIEHRDDGTVVIHNNDYAEYELLPGQRLTFSLSAEAKKERKSSVGTLRNGDPIWERVDG